MMDGKKNNDQTTMNQDQNDQGNMNQGSAGGQASQDYKTDPINDENRENDRADDINPGE